MLAKINRGRAGGVSLIEVMVAIAIIGILLGLGAPSFADMVNRRRVQMIAETLSTDLAYARAESGLGRSSSVFVQFARPASMTCYTVFSNATTGTCLCSRPVGAACTSMKVEIRTLQVPSSMGVSMKVEGQMNVISFDPPLMTPSVPNGFAVTVTGVRGSKLQVQVNAMGRVSICVPAGGNFSGVQACPA